MSDEKILALLKENPELGMEQLVSQYTGLLWSLASRFLSDPEDVKECVNETFAEFFYHRSRFDPQKGSLKGYLAAIVKRLAVKQYWQEQQHATHASSAESPPEDPFLRLEQSDALEAALKTLEPVDEAIIRMKYYGGMTAREIAVSLGMPYETVKKRHQRSLKKLLKALTIGLIVAALLAACAYVALRYFGIVPNYGVNTDPDSAIYILEDSQSVETADYQLTITDAWWNNGLFLADATLTSFSLPESLPNVDMNTIPSVSPQFQLTGLEDVGSLTIIHRPTDSAAQNTLRIMVSAALPEDSGTRLEVTLLCDGTPLSLVLRPAAEELLPDEAGYYSLTEQDGGLLAIPRLEDGELIVSIYPLNAGAFQTDVGLTHGVWAGFGGAALPITVTAEDGTVLTGHPLQYSPYSGDAYLDWSFGAAEAGAYTLSVPYVYQTAIAGEDFEQELLLPETATTLELSLPLACGSLTLEQLSPTEPVEAIPCGETMLLFPAEMYEDHLWWILEASWDSDSQERIPAAVPLSVSPASSSAPTLDTDIHLRTQTAADASGSVYVLPQDYLLHTNDPTQPLLLRLDPSNVCYRWNHSFQIPFQVVE